MYLFVYDLPGLTHVEYELNRVIFQQPYYVLPQVYILLKFGPSIKDVRKYLAILDPSLPLSANVRDPKHPSPPDVRIFVKNC